MKKYVRLFVSFFLFSALSFDLHALDASIKPMVRPEFLETSDFKSWRSEYSSYQEFVYDKINSGFYQTTGGKGTLWQVFSDRADNTTYGTPGGKPIGKLNYKEKVYIADISNGWAHVVSDANVSNNHEFSSKAVDKGWIKVENLLLWPNCPVNERNILKKGLIVQNLDKSQKARAEANYMDRPSANGNVRGDLLFLDILFILKETQSEGKKYYLLSRGASVGSGDVLLGWISEDLVTEWDQRLCLEPSSSKDVIELRDKGIYPHAFGTQSSAEEYMRNPTHNPEGVVKSFNSTFEELRRPSGYVIRSPILSEKKTDLFYSVVIGSTKDEEIVSEEDRAKLTEELEKATSSLSHINVIFVLDATNSMKSYFVQLSDALQDVLNNRGFDRDVKVGVVVYRNKADGEHEIEYRRVTDDVEGIADYIINVPCFSKGSGYYESFYKGLETALDSRKMGYDESHNNFIVAVGDCGNEEDEKKLRKLGSELRRKRIHFFAYNVAVGDDPAYRRYKNQVVSLLRGSMDPSRNCVDIVNSELYKIFRKEKGECSHLYDNTRFGGVRLASSRNMATNTFRVSVTSTVNDFIDDVNQQVSMIQARLSGSNISTGDETFNWSVICDIMMDRGLWTDSDCENFKRMGVASKLASYTPVKVFSSNQKLFDYVLLFSYNELTELVQELKKANDGLRGSSFDDSPMTRKNFQDALIKLGVSFVGESEESVRNMDFEELLQKIYGVPVRINTCGISSIKDLTNPELIDGEKFRNYASRFLRQLRELESILATDLYRESFQIENSTYYWIPFSVIPGYCVEE